MRRNMFAEVSLQAAVATLTLIGATFASAEPESNAEARVIQAWATYGVSGRGVIVAPIDRGIDWKHPDFRNADGSTRIEAIFDLMDDRGAAAAGNTYGKGTIYTRAQINAALTAGTELGTRDAHGHGSATAGGAVGNGAASSGKYRAPAYEATLVVVKFTSAGAPAHGSFPAEAAFYDPARLPLALRFVTDTATRLGLPVVTKCACKRHTKVPKVYYRGNNNHKRLLRRQHIRY